MKAGVRATPPAIGINRACQLGNPRVGPQVAGRAKANAVRPGRGGKAKRAEQAIPPDHQRPEIAVRFRLIGAVVNPMHCQRRLFVVDPEGSQNAKVDTLRHAGERQLFHFRGIKRATFPRFEPVARNYAQAYLGNLGVAIAVPAIVAELAAGDCRAAPDLPFAMLSVVVRPA